MNRILRSRLKQIDRSPVRYHTIAYDRPTADSTYRFLSVMSVVDDVSGERDMTRHDE